MPPYSKSIPSATGNEHFTRYFMSALAVWGSAENHFLKWSSVSEFGCRPVMPNKLGDMPFHMPHAFGSINAAAAVGAPMVTTGVSGAAVTVPVSGSVAVVVVVGTPDSGSVEVVCAYKST